ncbi:MAG: hypothetical protein ACK4NR_00935 [Micavibrio sp.]
MVDKMEIDNLAGFLESRGGVVDTFPQCGTPMPGENGPSLMAQHCQDDGMSMPTAKADIGSLVAPQRSISMKLGG